MVRDFERLSHRARKIDSTLCCRVLALGGLQQLFLGWLSISLGFELGEKCNCSYCSSMDSHPKYLSHVLRYETGLWVEFWQRLCIRLCYWDRNLWYFIMEPSVYGWVSWELIFHQDRGIRDQRDWGFRVLILQVHIFILSGLGVLMLSSLLTASAMTTDTIICDHVRIHSD